MDVFLMNVRPSPTLCCYYRCDLPPSFLDDICAVRPERHGVIGNKTNKTAKIHPWAFTTSNAFGGVHYGEHGHLCSAIASQGVLVPHNSLPQMHCLLQNPTRCFLPNPFSLSRAFHIVESALEHV